MDKPREQLDLEIAIENCARMRRKVDGSGTVRAQLLLEMLTIELVRHLSQLNQGAPICVGNFDDPPQ